MGVDVLQPLASSSGGAVDVSDRAGRLLGIVSSITSPVDVSDRAGRLLGIVASIAAPVDVSDRAGRLVGVVSSAQLPAVLVGGRLDVNIGAPATLPVSIAASVPVTSTQTSPADGLANTAGLPVVGQLEVWNPTGASWTRLREPTAASAVTPAGSGIASVTPYIANGVTLARALAGGIGSASFDGIQAVGIQLLAAGTQSNAWNDGLGATDGSTAAGTAAVLLRAKNAAGTFDAVRSGVDNADAVAGVAAGILRAAAEGFLWNATGGNWSRARDANIGDAAAAVGVAAAGGYVFNGATWDRARGDTTQGAQVGLKRVTLVQAASPAANTGATLTLPAAGAGLFHYITHIYIDRHATAALAGGATLAVTTTNLNGLTWRTGNQASITVSTSDGMLLTDAEYVHPIRSAVANTASTIVLPAPGAAVLWTAWVAYYTGP